MSSRRKARILAFQALYAWDASQLPVSELLEFAWLEPEKLAKFDDEARTFASLVIHGAITEIQNIDRLIQAHVTNWSFDRLKRVDVAILRTAVYSLLFQQDVAAQITIDEAIEIAKEFGSDDSYRFINGVLDAIWKESRQQN